MEKLDDLVKKLLENEILTNKILENLENIKSDKNWSFIDFSIEMKDIDLASMEAENVVLSKYMWNDIAKLNIDLLLDFDYYKQFQFKSRYDLPAYENILKLMGYKYFHKLWICCSLPNRNIAIKSILYSKLFDEVYKEKFTLTENEEFLQKWDIENYFNSVCLKSKKVINKCDKICKICDSPNDNFETICSFCEYQFSSEDEELVNIDHLETFCHNEQENKVTENSEILNIEESQITNSDNIDYLPIFAPNESNEIAVAAINNDNKINGDNDNNNPIENLSLNESRFDESSVDKACMSDCRLINRNIERINNTHWQCNYCTFINENSLVNCWACQKSSKFPIVSSTVISENNLLRNLKIFYNRLLYGFFILLKIIFALLLLIVIIGEITNLTK